MALENCLCFYKQHEFCSELGVPPRLSFFGGDRRTHCDRVYAID